jgi:geranylgeranyl reductase family protein
MSDNFRIETPDIVIVGLGPAGSRAASAAAAAGLDVVALERRTEAGRPVQCAELVPALLDQEVRGLGAARRQTVGRMCTQVECEPADELDNFPGSMIDRAAFDGKLAADAARAGTDCRFGVSLSGVGPDGVVHGSDGSALRPRVVIGADGPRSRIGAAIGRANLDLVETRQITVPLLAPHDATDIFLRADYRGGYGWLFPKGAVANFGIGVVPDARRSLKPLLAALHHELVHAGRVGRDVLCLTGGAIPVGGRLVSMGWLGRVPVLLAGDAAGLANPVTGAGIAAAVQSGTLAGQAAAAWLSGTSHALDGYEDELHDIFDAALARALRRRRALLAAYGRGRQPDRTQLRAGWIAYPEYWAA